MDECLTKKVVGPRKTCACTMKKSLLWQLAAFLVLVAGCSSEDYSDPQDFAEKYIREDFEKHCPRKLWKLLQYEDVRLENVESKMTQSLAGPVNQIVCEVRIVPEKKAKHYKVADLDWSFAWSPGYVSPLAKSYIATEIANRIETKAGDLEKKKPLLVRRISVGDRKPGKGIDTITCYRTRNEHGVFVPLSVGEKTFLYEGVFHQFDPKRRFGDKLLKGLGGLDVDEPGGRAAYVAFSNRCMKIRSDIALLNDLAKQLQNVTNDVRWGARSFVQNRRAELYKSLIEPLELARKEQENAYSRRCNERAAKQRDWNRQQGNLERERKRLADAQAEREKSRVRATARLEELRVASMTETRRRQLQNMQREMSNLEAKLEGLAKSIQAGDARLAEILSQQGAIRDASEKLAAEASADKEESTAKSSVDKERIEARKREVLAKVADEARVRLEDLTMKFQTCLEELNNLL